MQNGVARDDLYQIVTYMHTMKIDNGGFIYPIPQSDFEKDKKSYKLSGIGGTITTFGFPIPQSAKTPADFAAKMQAAEAALCNMTATKIIAHE